ncbi:aldo/keto reductase family protein [Arcobacter sp.]|uniref:aldo/keto reductase family protein n=1 Tax=Arcobacter sp. TaxID=1872629 RepID=UPI003D0B674C
MNIPKLIYGTAWKKEETTRLVELAVKSGFRAIDTACQPRHYNEKGVGDALQNLYAQGFKREEIFLETKFTPKDGQDLNNIPYNPNDSLEKQVLDSFDVSLKNLQTSYFDSYILHSPIFPFNHMMKVWKIFESFYEKGKTKNIGISNCYDIRVLKALYKEAKIKPTILQNRFYKDSDYDKEIRVFCKENNIKYLGFWTLSANLHILGSKEIINLARQYKKTQAQIFYRFLTQIEITPLNGTTSHEHMIEDLDIFSFELSNNEIEEISTLLN